MSLGAYIIALVKKALKSVVVLAVLFKAFYCFAIGPHELLVVVNDASIDSVLLGQTYCALRDIPTNNLVRLDIPKDVFDYETSVNISRDNFTKYIWEPISKHITDRGISNTILACVYSCGFPTTIGTTPEVSITGLTFLRNQLPTNLDAIASATYVSPLFMGQLKEGDSLENTHSLNDLRLVCSSNYPLPSFMLSYVGARGMTYDEAENWLIDIVEADFTMPKGVVWFRDNADVRSECRRWQYSDVKRLVNDIDGFSSCITTNFPASTDAIVGYMIGARSEKVSSINISSGAYCDNLTSYGAKFDIDAQMKITEWLKHGAGFTAGTVTEPYAIWPKFASASVFLHYLRGATAIESFYQATRCPLQILPLGDPLCKPWAMDKDVGILVDEKPLVSNGSLKGSFRLMADFDRESYMGIVRFAWYVDGVEKCIGRTFQFNSSDYSDGVHTIRLVARYFNKSRVRLQSYVEKRIMIKN